MGYSEISAIHVRGRKDYACEWCGQKIEKGLRQLYRVYRYEGDLNQGRMHLECEKAMYETPNDELMDGWTWGSNPRPLTQN